jgi:hypothetical protein
MRSSRPLALLQVAGMVEPAGLQIGFVRRKLGKRGLRQDFLGDVVDRAIGE